MNDYKYFDDLEIELIDGDRGKNYPKNDEMFDSGYCLFLNAKNVTIDGFKFDENVFISKEKDDLLRKGKLNRNDIVLTTRGTIGNVGFYNDKVPYDNVRINSGMLIIRNNDSNINTKYLYYQMTSPLIRNQIFSLKTGTAQPQIPITVLKKLKLFIPDRAKQDMIVKIMDSITDKIFLNNTINNNLYDISKQLLLKYMEENSNCYQVNISELLNVFTGKKNANETSLDGKYKFFSCGPECLLSDTYLYDGAAIIVAGNGAYTGRTKFYEGKFELYQRTYGLTLKEGLNSNNIYGLYVFMKVFFEPEKMGGTHGSAIPYIVLSDLADYKLKYNKIEFDKFSNKVSNNIKLIQNNEQNNETLSKLRDTLLPKLITGEIKLENIDI